MVIPWDNVWIYSVAGSQDREIGTTTMDIEETMAMEDPATTAEEPAIIPTYLKEEATSRAGSAGTRPANYLLRDAGRDYCRLLRRDCRVLHHHCFLYIQLGRAHV